MCDSAEQYAIGARGINGTILPFPTADDTYSVLGDTICQYIEVPAGGLAVSKLAAYGSGPGVPNTAVEYTLSLHDGHTYVTEATGNFTPGQANVLALPGQVTLEPGDSFVCITVPAGKYPVVLATEDATRTVLRFPGPGIPANVSLGNETGYGTNKSASLYVIGVSGTIFDFPYTENFDNWGLCDAKGCSIVTGPCPAQDGWVNPEGDDFDWSVWFGDTDSRRGGRFTGPQADHTTGNPNVGGGRYVYAEASPPCGATNQEPGTTAFLQTPVINVQKGWYLSISFWMHMYGKGDSQLHFDMSWDGGVSWMEDVRPYIRGNKGDAWLQYAFELTDLVWVYGNPLGTIFRFRSISGNVTEISFEGDIAIDDVVINAYTATPSPTPTVSATATSTQTITTIPTTTSTATPVPTHTATATESSTPERPYIPIGIPDPVEIVTPAWASVSPGIVIVSEIATIQLRGLWLYGKDEKIDVKFAVWAENCIGMGEGSAIATLDKHNVAKIQVPTVPGQYLLCIRHRQDWEHVSVIDVIPQNVNMTNYGYTTCDQFLRFNSEFCGCFYQKGESDVEHNMHHQPTYTLPLDKPHWLLPYGNQTALFEQGCCRRGSMERHEFTHNQTGIPSKWGMCKDHAGRGQLGDFTCPNLPGGC